MKKFLILLIFLSFNVYSQNTIDELIREITPIGDLPNAELKNLRQDLKIQSQLIEGVLELQQLNPSEQNIEKISNNLNRAIKLATNARAIQIGERIQKNVEEVIETTIHPTQLKSEIVKLKEFIKNDLTKKGIRLTSLGRRFGLSVGLFYLAVVQIDFTIPLVLMATGTNIKLAAALFVSPISSTSTAAFMALKSTLKYKHLLKTLGYKETKEHFKIFLSIQKFINKTLVAKNYLMDMNIAGTQFLLTLEESNAITRLLNKLGLRKGVNYGQLINFLQENQLYPGFTRRMMNSPISDIAKMLKIMRKIQIDGDEKTALAFQKAFGKKIQVIRANFQMDHHINWFLKLSSAKSMEDFFSLMANIPKDMAPKSFDKAWRNVVLPSIADNFGKYISLNHYKVFRHLYEDYQRNLRPILISNQDYHMPKNLEKTIQKYVFSSFSSLNSCGYYFMPSTTGSKHILFY